MNSRTTFIVLLIAVALTTWFLVFEMDYGAEDVVATPDEAIGEPLLAGVDATKIDRLTIRAERREPIVLQRSDGQWRQTEPVTWPAKSWRIDQIADAAVALRYTRTLADGTDSAKYGLSPARRELVLEGEGFSHTIRLGREAAAGKAFAAVDSHTTVYVVDDELHAALRDLSPTALRDAGLAEIAAHEIDRIQLSGNTTDVTLARSDGRWVFDVGAAGRVDESAVEAIVGVIEHAAIEQFIADRPDDLTRYGLAEPRRTLTVSAGDRSHTLRIGDARDLTGRTHLAMFDDRPVVFTLADGQVSALDKSVDDLRDRRLTPVTRGDVREIHATRADRADLHVVMREGVWRGRDMPFEVDLGVVSDLLSQLLQARAERFIEPGDAGQPVEAAATVRLAVAGQDEDERLTVTRHDGTGDYLNVRRNDEAVFYQVKPESLTRLFDPLPAYRDRTVLDLSADQINRLTIERRGEVTRDIVRNDAGQWQLDGIDQPNFERLLTALTPLRARTWTDREPTEATLTLRVSDEIYGHVIHLDPDAMLGWTDAGVFELQAATMDALTAELRQRTVIDWDVERMTSIQIGDLTVRRTEAGRYERADGEMIDEEAAGQLFDMLAGLRAERFIDEGTTKFDPADPSLKLTLNAADASVELLIWLTDRTDRAEPRSTGEMIDALAEQLREP